MTTWGDVATALLGRWPTTVGAWRPEVLEAFLLELQVQLTADDALYAIRAWRGGDQIIPPSVPQLEAVARSDPDRPTADEMLEQIWDPGGLLGFKRSDAPPVHSMVVAFAEFKDLGQLRELYVDGDDGRFIRNDLKRSYEEFVDVAERREVAALAGGYRRGELRRMGDPLAAAISPGRGGLELVREDE